MLGYAMLTQSDWKFLPLGVFMRILIFFLWCYLAFQATLALAEEKIEETSTQNAQTEQHSQFFEVDFLTLYKEFKENKAKMTDFAFKTWWKQINTTLEGKYVKGTAIVKNVKDGLTGLHVKMGAESEDDALSVLLYLDKKDESEVKTALTLEPGKPLTFTGRLDGISKLGNAVSVFFDQGAIGHEFKIPEEKVPAESKSKETASKDSKSSIDVGTAVDGISVAIKVLKFVVKRGK
jgi:hypothetical protein